MVVSITQQEGPEGHPVGAGKGMSRGQGMQGDGRRGDSRRHLIRVRTKRRYGRRYLFRVRTRRGDGRQHLA